MEQINSSVGIQNYINDKCEKIRQILNDVTMNEINRFDKILPIVMQILNYLTNLSKKVEYISVSMQNEQFLLQVQNLLLKDQLKSSKMELQKLKDIKFQQPIQKLKQLYEGRLSDQIRLSNLKLQQDCKYIIAPIQSSVLRIIEKTEGLIKSQFWKQIQEIYQNSQKLIANLDFIGYELLQINDKLSKSSNFYYNFTLVNNQRYIKQLDGIIKLFIRTIDAQLKGLQIQQ